VNAEATTKTGDQTRASLEGYYRLHSKIYDATRWTFLFGRNVILRKIAAVATPTRILEVGCGTGKNLVNLCGLFPQAEITGVDLSDTMLKVARRKIARFGPRVQLAHCGYGGDFAEPGAYDLILFSYALTMFNPGFEDAIAAARDHLSDGGHLAVVDFHDTRFCFFERWMGVNHVRMNGQLRPLFGGLEPLTDCLCSAYGGIWRYLLFVGRKDKPVLS
jgi:S-adenosylmethionine-diacylgycerolhomoserine-N-methlytransferase